MKIKKRTTKGYSTIKSNRTSNRQLDGRLMPQGKFDPEIHEGTFKGKKHKQSSKDSIGEKNSIIQSGEGNSQFGTKWINKDGVNKKISSEQIDSFLEEGWVIGRKDKSNFQSITQETIDKIISLHQEGCKNIEIVEMLQLSKKTVGKYLKIWRESNS